jgi:hypothetical protein
MRFTFTVGERCAMMPYRKISEYLLAEPFRPFRIMTVGGQAFDIRHPEMLLVGRATAKVYTATGPEENERWHDVSLLLIETMEPLETLVAR